MDLHSHHVTARYYPAAVPCQWQMQGTNREGEMV